MSNRTVSVEHTLQMLLEQYVHSREQAISLGKQILSSDPRFDVNLLEYVEETRLIDHSEQAVLCILDVLDEISERDRLVLNVLGLLKHPNPKLRSKAARIIGKRRPNASWIVNLMTQPDPRVRANAVESLFHSRDELSRPLFLAAAGDQHNRVAGNARLGLYLLGDAAAIPSINELADDPRPAFRNTGAWVMGQTQDARFVPALTRLISDPDETVRSQALQSLRKIRKANNAPSDKQPLHLSILQHAHSDGEHRLRIAAYDVSGERAKNIPGTAFSVKVDGRFVHNYKVEEHVCPNCLDVAFVMCLPKDHDDTAKSVLESAIELCSPIRRPSDRWVIAKLTHNSFWVRFGQPYLQGSPGGGKNYLFYTSDPARISQMLKDRPIYLVGDAPEEPLSVVTRGLFQGDFNGRSPHVIILGDSVDPQLITLLDRRRRSASFVFHALVDGHSSDGSLESLVEKSNGTFKFVSAADQYGAALVALYSSLLHYYGISWSEDGQQMEVQVNTPAACGSVTVEASGT